MMYCSVREAYDNPLQKKLEEYQNNNNNSYQLDFRSATPKRPNDSDNNEEIIQAVQNNQDQYNVENNQNQYNIDKQIVQHPVFVPSFFTAQGDYANQGPNNENTNNIGTHIDELKDCSLDSGLNNQYNLDDMFTLDDSLSFLDSNSVLPQNNNQVLPEQLDYLLDKPKSKSKRSHQYYIKKFVMAMIDETSNSDHMSNISIDNSIGSSSFENFANYDVYNHVKRCKYCRSEAHKRLRSYYAKENKDETNIKKEGFIGNNFTIPKDILLGYDLKEIVIMIIIGIILIFILDLFVKIGRKTMNLKNTKNK